MLPEAAATAASLMPKKGCAACRQKSRGCPRERIQSDTRPQRAAAAAPQCQTSDGIGVSLKNCDGALREQRATAAAIQRVVPSAPRLSCPAEMLSRLDAQATPKGATCYGKRRLILRGPAETAHHKSPPAPRLFARRQQRSSFLLRVFEPSGSACSPACRHDAR